MITVSKGEGIVVKTPKMSISLDPKRASRCEYTFVSHAHIDHVHSPSGKSKIIASKETAALAKVRGYDLGQFSEQVEGVRLFDAGHILGSRAILIEESVLYTGDFSRRDRGFLKGLKGISCDTLIMESTYGKNRYVFRETEEIVRQVSRIIGESFHHGRPVILTGYALGKAQLLSYLFHNWDPIYVHDSVHKLNATHIELGIGLREFEPFSPGLPSLDRPPWILITPSASARSHLIATMKQKYGAVVIGFTGWSLDPGYKYMMGLDYAFDVSDHSDYEELLTFAKECNPRKILTVHGFASELAEDLRSLGFDADPLEDGDGQSRLSGFT